jgi:thioesterase domain-containing protein
VSLPLSTLFEANTIADLARVVTRSRHGDSDAPWRSLVTIKEGTAPPLVCIHSLSGDVLEYRDIARHLTGPQQVLGLQAVLGENVESIYATLEATATEYLAQLRTAQPAGPYYLCGWSSGGALALEMAQQLLSAGEAVALLAIIDSAPFNVELKQKPSPFRQLLRQLANIPAWVREDLLLSEPSDIFARARHKLSVWTRRTARHAIGGQETVRDVVDFPRRTASWEHFAEIHFSAFKRYVPKSYAGRVSVFTAPTHPLTWLNDPAPIWRQLATTVDVYPVAGTHFSIVKEPNVGVLARAIATAFDRARANTSSTDLGESRK